MITIKRKLELISINKVDLIYDIISSINTNNREEMDYINYVKFIINKDLPYNYYDRKTYREVLSKKTKNFDDYHYLLIKEVRLEKIRLLKKN